MLANDHVVTNLDEIVDFRATADLSVVQGAPVNRAIGPDFDVVLDDHSADLRNLAVVSLIKNVAEPVRADYCAGVNADALGQAASVVDADVWKKVARLAKRGIVPDRAVRLENGVIPDCDVFPDYAIRANVGSLGDVGRVGDYRAWVNSGNKLFLGKEKWQHLGECNPGIFDLNHCLGFRLEFSRRKDGTRLALLGQAKEFFILGERQIPGRGGVGFCETGKFGFSIAKDVPVYLLGYFVGGEIHASADVSLLFDGVVFAKDDDAGLVVGAGFLVEQAEGHDSQPVTRLAKVRRGSIEDHLAVTPFAWDGVGLEAIAVGEVAANDTFVREKVHLVHQVGIDG